jgi:hypothetical protein
MPRIQKVSSTHFAGRFGQWSFAAQSAPVMVTNQKTGVVLGYFVSAPEFESYLALRDLLPKARFAWEMPDDLAAELERPLPHRRPELDALMEE